MEDFPGKQPLPGRANIMLTRTRQVVPGFAVATSPQEALELSKPAQRTFVIGGGSIYEQMLPLCDTAYVTKVHLIPESDTFFPNLDENADWEKKECLQSGEENGIAYEIYLYQRKGTV